MLSAHLSIPVGFRVCLFSPTPHQLGDVMVDIASNIMLADERVLWLAQREARACSRIVQCLQRIATYRLANGAHVYSTVSFVMSAWIMEKGIH